MGLMPPSPFGFFIAIHPSRPILVIPLRCLTAYKAPMKVPKRLKPLVEDGLMDEMLFHQILG